MASCSSPVDPGPCSPSSSEPCPPAVFPLRTQGQQEAAPPQSPVCRAPQTLFTAGWSPPHRGVRTTKPSGMLGANRQGQGQALPVLPTPVAWVRLLGGWMAGRFAEAALGAAGPPPPTSPLGWSQVPHLPGLSSCRPCREDPSQAGLLLLRSAGSWSLPVTSGWHQGGTQASHCPHPRDASVSLLLQHLWALGSRQSLFPVLGSRELSWLSGQPLSPIPPSTSRKLPSGRPACGAWGFL